MQSFMLACLSMLVGEEGSECSEGSLTSLSGRAAGSINGTLGEKHLSPRLQYNIHSYGVMAIGPHIHKHTYIAPTTNYGKSPKLKPASDLSESFRHNSWYRETYAGIMVSLVKRLN